ncbi:MAG: molybdopterin synthase catalytic subunit MoaE [Pseudomonadota bacterium]
MGVRVQSEDFDVGQELDRLRAGNPNVGALASFIGLMRDINDGEVVSAMTLEHYPGMTERALEKIVAQARQRWDVIDILVVHRVGPLRPQDRIVLVAAAAVHREPAFRACEFVIDYLKTQAPFWKKEQTRDGGRWVEARDSDAQAAGRWAGDD